MSFAELVDEIDNLSIEELQEMKKILEKKWMAIRQEEIIKAVEEARKESAEGKTLVFSSPEEIKSYFEKLPENGNSV